MTRSRRRTAVRHGLLTLVLVPVLLGCSLGAPYAPGPSVVPSAPAGPASPAVRPADLDLSGDVTTADGLSFHVVHRVQLGRISTTLPDRSRAPVGWTQVQRATTGETTVTNTSTRPNPAAAATLYTFYAAYPAGSTVCRLSAREGRGDAVGNRCWLRLGTTVPYSYGRDETPTRLGVGESRTGIFDALPPEAVDTPVGQFEEVAEALRRPADIVVLAFGIGGIAHPAYRNACGKTGTETAVIVGGSSPLGCRDVPSGG